MTRLGIIFGGQSSEYSVSLHSVSSLLRQFHKDKYEITLIGITKDGKSYLYNGSVDDIEHDRWLNDNCIPCSFCKGGIILNDSSSKKIELDVAFPVVHGKNCEDGTLQGMLEVNNIHFVGCGTLSSAMCMDKEITHILCDNEGIPCAKYICMKQGEEVDPKEIEKVIPLPWIVKSCNAGSSYGVNKVHTLDEFEYAKNEAFKYDGRGKLLVEEFVEGKEIGCAVLGNKELFVGSLDEIDTKKELFDFGAKYELEDTQIICPARLSEEQTRIAQTLAIKVYKTMNCRGFARVDMFVRKDGSIILNEINTIPGLTSASRYPTMMKEVGIEFGDLIDKLVDLAKENNVGSI